MCSLGFFTGGAVGAYAGRQPRDLHVAPADARRSVGTAVGERVLEESNVVARRAIRVETLVRAARLAPGERGVRHHFGDFQLVAELEGRQPLGVPALGRVGERGVLQAL